MFESRELGGICMARDWGQIYVRFMWQMKLIEWRNYRFDWRILHNIQFGIFVLNGELFESLRYT